MKFRLAIEAEKDEQARMKHEFEENVRSLKLSHDAKMETITRQHHLELQQMRDKFDVQLVNDVERGQNKVKVDMQRSFDIDSKRIQREADEFAARKIKEASTKLEKEMKDMKQRMNFDFDIKLEQAVKD